MNVDFESAIPEDELKVRIGFTKLISMLTVQMKQIDPHYQVNPSEPYHIITFVPVLRLFPFHDA